MFIFFFDMFTLCEMDRYEVGFCKVQSAGGGTICAGALLWYRSHRLMISDSSTFLRPCVSRVIVDASASFTSASLVTDSRQFVEMADDAMWRFRVSPSGCARSLLLVYYAVSCTSLVRHNKSTVASTSRSTVLRS